ncbi:MAG: Xaa-Pro peptidase family protein [Patescibacteria group bacterium]|nr:Xaa-Pro peptidase family protein [Patescibacteria group bacterium]
MIIEPFKCLLVTKPTNIRYLTGFAPLSGSNRSSYLALTRDTWHLFTFPLYEHEAEEAKKKHPNLNILYISPAQRFTNLLTSLCSSIQVLLFEQDSLTYKEYNEIRSVLPTIQLLPHDGTIERLRAKKSSEERSFIQQAAKLTDDCFIFIQSQIHEGMTETELSWIIERYIREHNASLSFPPIVAFNEHSSIPHHVSSEKKLSQNSIILIDFGAAINGYHADMTRVIFLGTPRNEWVNAYMTVKQAHDAAIQYMSMENSGARADELARSMIKEKGYPEYPHSLGHGVGLDIHEDPRLSVHKDVTIEEGMVFTIEPAIYLPGQFGIRIEDLVLKTHDSIEILSKSPYYSNNNT